MGYKRDHEAYLCAACLSWVMLALKTSVGERGCFSLVKQRDETKTAARETNACQTGPAAQATERSDKALLGILK